MASTKPSIASPWKYRVAFFVMGFVVCVLWIRLLFDWIEDTPDRLRNITGWTLVVVPIGAVFLLRAIIGQRVRGISYLLGAIAALFIGAWLFPGDPMAGVAGARQFDARHWRAQTGGGMESRTPRQRMVGDFLATGQLDGLNRAEVIELLGPPSDLEYLEDVRPPCDLWYYLGPWRSFLESGSEWLLVTLNEDNRVLRYWRWKWQD